MMKYATGLAAAALFCMSAAAFDEVKAEKCDNASFVKKAACGNLCEVAMGKCAQENATSPAVKEFAAKMVKAHTKAQEELKEACTASKTECPTEMTKEGKAACDKCEKAKGEKDFDIVYISMQVECHEKALKLFEKASKEVECENLRAYAEKAIPVLKEHLAAAKEIKAKVAEKSGR